MGDTAWNGQPVDARRCRVVVGSPPDPVLDTRRSTGAEMIDATFERGDVAPNAVIGNTGTARTDPATSRRRWYAPLVGTERYAVEVRIGDLDPFYIDDEGYTLEERDLDLIESAARGLAAMAALPTTYEEALAKLGGNDPQRGSPGWGWAKVTEGRGLPDVGHASLEVKRVVEYLDDDAPYHLPPQADA